MGYKEVRNRLFIISFIVFIAGAGIIGFTSATLLPQPWSWVVSFVAGGMFGWKFNSWFMARSRELKESEALKEIADGISEPHHHSGSWQDEFNELTSDREDKQETRVK